MSKRDVIRDIFENKKPPYVPWAVSLNHEVAEALGRHFGSEDEIEDRVQNHILVLGHDVLGPVVEKKNGFSTDYFGVKWDQTVDQDCGTPTGIILSEPTLKNYVLPDPRGALLYAGTDELIKRYPDRWRVWHFGFSLYERAWSLRGMENLMVDFYENPEFAHKLFDALASYSCEVMDHVVEHYDIDAIWFGDDWGMQTGLQMGPDMWRGFIKPYAKKMYDHVHSLGKKVMIHSCGKVESLFDELIDIGLNCFNPFQPEVMDVHALLRQYRGRLSFHGGMSTQHTLPFGTVEDVKNETRALIDSGRDGNYIFSPAHKVDGDVPYENVLAFFEVLQAQDGAPKGL